MNFGPNDAVWVILAATLVFFMQAGFATREAGLVRSKNAINVATKVVAGTMLACLAYWAVGYAVMLGRGNEWMGTSGFLVGDEADGPTLAKLARNMALACVSATIVSGAVAERIRLAPYLLWTLAYAGVVYPLFGHWVLVGWLRQRGVQDFGGSLGVHALGGFAALAALVAVGPRAGRFVAGQVPAKIPGSSLPLAVLGTFLIWFGFVGETGGAALGDEALPHVVANTFLAGVSGGLAAFVIGWILRRKAEAELPMNGVLAGLCAVAAGAHAVSMPAAAILGAVAGGLTLAIERLLVTFKLDDAVGAVPVHLGGGVWGTLAVGIFGHPDILGVERSTQLRAQVEGVLVAGLVGFGATFLVLKLIAVFVKLRPSAEDEAQGLNVSEHDAHTELADLLDTMEDQARTGDIGLRAPVEPFTEVGAIARQYNRVMETIEFVTAQTESLVRTSLDGLLTFNTEGIITSSNPAASAIFGYSERELRNVAVTSLFAPSRDKAKGRADLQTLLKTFVGQTHEVRGIRRNDEEFTMEASFNYVSVGEDEIYTATFRDITLRKETEAKLGQAQAEIRRRLEQELEDAKVVQRALLPTETQFPGCEIARHYQAASETGGDWYGYYYHAEAQTITFYIGDVTGHGLPAALMSGVVCGAVYSAEYTHGVLGGDRNAERVVRNVAEVVNRIVLQTGKGELLMTMAFLHVNLRTGQVVFLNAGHNMPYIVKSGQMVSNLVGRGSRLGESNKPEFEVVHARLDPNDVVVLYTDGLIENQGPDGKCLSVRDVKSVLQTFHSAQEIRDELVARAKSVWQDRPVMDDHSIVVFRWTPSQAQSREPRAKGA